MKTNVFFSVGLPPFAPRDGITLLLPEVVPPGNEGYLAACRDVAKACGSPVVTAPFAHRGGLALAWLDGGEEVIQQVCFPDPGLSFGEDVRVFDTRWGRVALCGDADLFQPQYARLAALRGCQLLLASTCRMKIDPANLPTPEAIQTGGDAALFLAGPWASAQANGMAIAVAGLGGGRLVLPCPLTQDQSGLGENSFDPDQLARAQEEFPVLQGLNPAFYSRYRKELLA